MPRMLDRRTGQEQQDYRGMTAFQKKMKMAETEESQARKNQKFAAEGRGTEGRSSENPADRKANADFYNKRAAVNQNNASNFRQAARGAANSYNARLGANYAKVAPNLAATQGSKTQARREALSRAASGAQAMGTAMRRPTGSARPAAQAPRPAARPAARAQAGMARGAASMAAAMRRR